MAKKTLKELEAMILELEKQEQTPEVQAQIGEIKADIERRKKAAEAMQAGKEKNKAESETGKKKAKTNFLKYEEWEQERKMVDGKPKLVAKDKPNRTVTLLPEQADILNDQKENTLKEYVEVKESNPQ